MLALSCGIGWSLGGGENGKPPTAASVSVAFARLAKRLHVAGLSHHTFRHTGATVMVASSVSLRAVQAIGGWSTLRMVERYAHLEDAELQRAVRLTHAYAETATSSEGATKTATSTHTAARSADPKTEPK